jgi:AcrR family transcriptional regulator
MFLTGTFYAIYVPIGNMVKRAERPMLTRVSTRRTATAPRAIDRIRESARDLFYRRGIRAVGVDEIVSRAGVTKPSLYRSFASKDELTAAYLRDYGRDFFGRFEAVMAAHPGDPRAQIRAWMGQLGERATREAYRGCGITNAVVEYPDPQHPAHVAAAENKHALRARLTAIVRGLPVGDPEALGDGLMLLMEGAYATGQLFGPGGPAGHVADAADALIEAHLIRAALKRARPNA